MTQNTDFSLREAHNRTLHLLLDRGNLTYLFIAVGSILSASILGFILLMVTGAPIMGHLITILIKLATAFAVFVLASKTIDNIARIHAGLGQEPVPTGINSILDRKTVLQYGAIITLLFCGKYLIVTIFGIIKLDLIADLALTAVLIALIPAMSLAYLRDPSPLIPLQPASVLTAYADIGEDTYRRSIAVTLLAYIGISLALYLLLDIALVYLLQALLTGSASLSAAIMLMVTALIAGVNCFVYTYCAIFPTWYYPHDDETEDEEEIVDEASAPPHHAPESGGSFGIPAPPPFTDEPAQPTADSILPQALQAMKAQQYQRVLELTRNFGKAHPNHPHLVENYYLTALALAKTGAADKALPLLQQLHKRYPDHPRAATIAQAIARLQGKP